MCLSEKGQYPHLLEQELRLYRLMGDKFVNKAKDLPKGAVDLVIAALEQGSPKKNLRSKLGPEKSRFKMGRSSFLKL